MSRTYLRIGLLCLLTAVIVSGCTPAAKEARHLSRAESYFQAGDYNSAKIEYLNVLRLDHRSAEAYQQLGFIWEAEGDMLLGLQFLTVAQRLAPDNLEVQAKMGSAFLSLGDVKNARKEALGILKQDPGNGEAIVLLSNATRTKEDAEVTRQQLRKFPNQDTASWQLAMGGFLLATGDQAGAYSALQRAETLDPKSPEPHLAMARMLISQKNLPKAADEYKTAADLSPPRGVARLTYAEFELQFATPDQAKAILADISIATPDYLPAWILQARIAFSAKKPDEALVLLGHVLSQDTQNLDAHILQAQIWLAKGNAENVISDLRQMDDLDTGMPVVNYYLAQAYLQKGDTSQALTYLNRAVAAGPDYASADLLLATVNLRTGNATPVVNAMLDLLKRHPELRQARTLLATAYQSLKEYDDAIDVLRKEIQLYPGDAESYFMLGTTLLDQGNQPEARTAFEKAQELAPQSLLATFQLVDMDILASDFDSAFKRVQRKIAEQPKSAGAQFLLGKIYFAQKDWTHARAALLKALDEDGNLLIAYHYLAHCYMAENNTDEAINVLQMFLAKSPNDATALMDLGHLYDETRQPQKARETYERLLAVNPDSAPALNNLACSYAAQDNDLDKAEGYAQKALSLSPQDPSVEDTLGWILYRKGEYGQALNLLEQSVARPPAAPEILYHFGMASYMMDQPDAARTALEQAAESTADFAGKADIPSTLAFLDKAEPGTASQEDIGAFLNLHPADVYALATLGDFWKRQGDPVKAAASYQQALDRNPLLTSVALNLAELEAGPLHDPDKAFDLAKKVRELAPSDARAAGILGSITYRRGDFPQAYTLLQEAVNSTTDDAAAAATLRDFAWAAYSQGKVAEARDAMDRVTRAVPPSSPEAVDAQSFLALTDTNAIGNDPEAAGDKIAKALEATPDYAPALMARARIRVSQGDAKGAEADCASVLGRFPDFSPAQVELASLYLQDPDNQSKAYDLAAKAHKSLPDDPEAAKALAEASYQRKEYSYAVQLFEESAIIRPLDTHALYYLGMSLWQTKAMPESRQTLQQAIAAGLTEPDLSQANRILAQLQKK